MSRKKKRAEDTTGLSPAVVAQQSVQDIATANIQNNGTFGEPRLEPVPNFIQSESEYVISNKNNSWIVLGRDRLGTLESGFGGRGDTQCASMDLCVGRMASKPDSTKYVDPNPIVDAARIYISQKTDIYGNFNVSDEYPYPKEGRPPRWDLGVPPRSGVGIKADQVAIIGRETVKIVTNTDAMMSQGDKLKGVYGIELIAGNNRTGLQPLVKGGNLVDCIEKLSGYVSQLTTIVADLIEHQMKFNEAVLKHTHPPTPVAVDPLSHAAATIPVPQSVDMAIKSMMPTINLGAKTAPSLVLSKSNVEGFKHNYLSMAGPKYINSKSNQTN
jgi:hypothetical protein